jgi:hypothetical protein
MLLAKARRMSPEDTGNVKWNATRGKKWNVPTEFTINFSTADAYYIQYLQENLFAGGSINKKNKHKAYITKIYLELANDLQNIFNNNMKYKRSKRPSSQDIIGNTSRELRHTNSLAINQARRESGE